MRTKYLEAGEPTCISLMPRRDIILGREPADASDWLSTRKHSVMKLSLPTVVPGEHGGPLCLLPSTVNGPIFDAEPLGVHWELTFVGFAQTAQGSPGSLE